MKRKLILVLILILLPLLVFADELVLVKGRGVPVCEAHLRNLEELGLNEMVCQRDETYPEINGITRPKWEELDLRENKELVKKIHKFFGVGDQFGKLKIVDDDEEFEEYFNRILKYDSLKKTIVDINNNGKSEVVMLYREPRCDVERNRSYNIPYSRSLFVLDEKKRLMHVRKTELLLQNIYRLNVDIKSKAIESIYRLYDVFAYKGSIYFDKWNAYDWTLTVYKISNQTATEICQYKYISQ
ncbi:MAG: hypothetical protein HQL10_12310 [Nitrospirae bacterium]|nr:hypothetical protein [Nitrospirota bacterium]